VSELLPEDLRKQVIRRMRYATNVIALESNIVPPEGPLDVAMTNGLAAIVASVDPLKVYDEKKKGRKRILPARGLIQISLDLELEIDADALLDALNVTQPMRHGDADDEWVAPTAGHIDALRGLDAHPALSVLDRAMKNRRVDELLIDLYSEAAWEASGGAFASPDERILYMEPEECDECWRMTFVPDSLDEFGGTNSPGVCVACGYQRSAEDARRLALKAEWDRWSAANP
jgi:hypothetical protein